MLSPELQRFIRRNIVSVEQLEILLLLFDNPSKSWTTAEISARLRSTPTSVTRRLADLSRRQLVRETNGQFNYRSSSSNDERLEELRATYRLSPSRVIDTIFSEPDEALSSFADAFRLKPEETDRDR